MRPYGILLANGAVVDALGNICSTLTITRVFPANSALILSHNGPCTRLGGTFCHVASALLLFSLAHSNMTLVASFVYRYRSLKSGAAPASAVIVLVAVLWATNGVITV